MNKITEQTIYLLYTKAYSEDGTVTKGVVKAHLPEKELKEESEEIHVRLEGLGLIETKSRGRFSLTAPGKTALCDGLKSFDYQFTSVKGAKVLNTIIECLKKNADADEQPLTSGEDMPQERRKATSKKRTDVELEIQNIKPIIEDQAIYWQGLSEESLEKELNDVEKYPTVEALKHAAGIGLLDSQQRKWKSRDRIIQAIKYTIKADRATFNMGKSSVAAERKQPAPAELGVR